MTTEAPTKRRWVMPASVTSDSKQAKVLPRPSVTSDSKPGIDIGFVPSNEAELTMFVGSIYYITSLSTDRVYVGSTTRTTKQRWLEHLHYLRKGTHHSPHLQRVYDKYGEGDLFMGAIAEVYDKSELLPLEQHHIDLTKGRNMNGAPIAESIEAAHAANRGRVMSDAEKIRRSIAAKRSIVEGRAVRGPWSDERKAAHSICLTGRKMPPVPQQRRDNISAGQRLRNALLGTAAKPKTYRYAFIAAELPMWIDMRSKGESYRTIETLTGRARSVIARECKRAMS